MRRSAWFLGIVVLVISIPMLALALYPPTAFDETMYHLPLVRAIAEEGVRFHEDLRFPVFPLLAELLAVPAYLVGGDIATHALPLLATLLTAVVLLALGRLRGGCCQLSVVSCLRSHATTHSGSRIGLLAAAAFLGAPIVVHLATSLYVESVLTLFVTAGFYCIDRALAGEAYATNHHEPATSNQQLILAGLFLGAACAVKYLGLYFAAAGAVVVLLRARPRFRTTALYVLGVLVAALPMYVWIYAQTGNPLFPYFSVNAWTADLPQIGTMSDWLVRFIRIPWDVLFARERIGMQPPFTPFFALALIAIVWRSKKTILLPLGYLLAFTFLPRDARYLVPLLPLVLIEAATVLDTIAMPRWILPTLVILAILPGPAYAIYRIARQGPIPRTASQRTAYLERRVPEYRALQRAGNSRVYACGGEQLKAYAAGPFLGDHFGPHSYTRVLDHGRGIARIHANLLALHIDTLLVVKRTCTYLPLPAKGFTLIYEDEAAQLWRVKQ